MDSPNILRQKLLNGNQCPKCNSGRMFLEADNYGQRTVCYQCGFQRDIEKPADNRDWKTYWQTPRPIEGAR